MRRAILLVAIADSVHTWRWIRMLEGGPRPIVVLPATSDPCLDDMSGLPRISSAREADRLEAGDVVLWPLPPAAWTEAPDCLPAPVGFGDRRRIVRGAAIVDVIRGVRPAFVHSLEIQLAGYACLRAAEMIGSEFPRWLVSNWGSDLLLYEKLAEHRPVLETLAGRADAFISECHRDIEILRHLGYRKEGTYVLPASGGADFDVLEPSSNISAPSSRREVVVKGYHGWSGRGVHVLSALALAAPALSGFLIRVVLASPSVVETAPLFARNSGLNIVVEPWFQNHGRAVNRLSRARIMVGIGISDGIGTSLLEAMALGAFPVVAKTACADEWIRQAKDGFFVDVHDMGTLARAIERAASDDDLVDAAARRNRSEVERRWNVRINRKVALAIYDAIAAGAE